MIMNKAQWDLIQKRIADLEKLTKAQAGLLHLSRAKSNYSQYEWKLKHLEVKRMKNER